MVFERKHFNTDKNTPIGHIADVLGDTYGNNTNASGYINRIRLKRRREELEMQKNNVQGQMFHNDPPPPED